MFIDFSFINSHYVFFLLLLLLYVCVYFFLDYYLIAASFSLISINNKEDVLNVEETVFCPSDSCSVDSIIGSRSESPDSQNREYYRARPISAVSV